MKKHIFLVICFILVFSLTGCNNKDIKLNLQSFNLNFRYFLLPNTQSVQSVKLNSIDLENDVISINNIEKCEENLEKLYKEASSSDYYYNNDVESFYTILNDYCFENNLEVIKEQNDFKESIDNIFNENLVFYDINIISLNNKNGSYYYECELICTDELNLVFYIEYLNIYIDVDNNILQIELLDEFKSYNNTTKPLTKDSLLNENNIHKDFYSEYVNLLSLLKNSSLYNNYYLAMSDEILMTDTNTELTQEQINSKEYLADMEFQVNTLINNLNNDLDKEILKEFFIAGEGIYVNTYITEYKIQDYEGLALSYYTITSISNGKEYKFIFTFDRIDKKIVNIERESD